MRMWLTRLAVGLLMSGTASADPREAPPPRKNDPDAVRCVKLPVTGSLAQFRRTCMTNRDWEQQRDDARRLQGLTCSDQRRCGSR